MSSLPAATPRSPRNAIGDAEWQARVELAACYRLAALYGMADMIDAGAGAAGAFPAQFARPAVRRDRHVEPEMRPPAADPDDRACQAQLAAMSCNPELNLMPDTVVDRSVSMYDPKVIRRYRLMEWPALPRQLDRSDPSHKN